MNANTSGNPQDLWNDQVKQGMVVMSADGERLGTVARVRETDFRIDREATFDVDVPMSAIKDIDEEFVTLNLKADELDSTKMGGYPYDKHADADEAPKPKDINL